MHKAVVYELLSDTYVILPIYILRINLHFVTRHLEQFTNSAFEINNQPQSGPGRCKPYTSKLQLEIYG